MKIFWRRFLAALTPGARGILVWLTACFLAALAGRLTHTVDLYRWLPVGAAEVWHGQIWRIISYTLLPSGVVNFALNAVALALLGPLLERHWTRHELWWYCGVAAAAGGLTAALLAGPGVVITGAEPMVFGLLIAWGIVSGHETCVFPIFGPATVRQVVLVLAAVSLLGMLLSNRLAVALVVGSGGAAGWLYLWLRRKWLLSPAGRAAASERFNRLEL